MKKAGDLLEVSRPSRNRLFDQDRLPWTSRVPWGIRLFWLPPFCLFLLPS